jgi:hypothetical protein
MYELEREVSWEGVSEVCEASKYRNGQFEVKVDDECQCHAFAFSSHCSRQDSKSCRTDMVTVGQSTHSCVGIDHERLLPFLHHHFKLFTRHLVHNTGTTASLFSCSQNGRSRSSRSSPSGRRNPRIRSKCQCAAVVVAAEYGRSGCDNQPKICHCQ